MVNKLQHLLIWSMGLLMLGLPVSQVLSANLSQWRPTTVAQASRPMAAQDDPRFRPVVSQPQPVPQVAVAVPVPQVYYPPQPIAPPVYAPHYTWHMPQQAYTVPQVVQPQPVQPMVVAKVPEVTMRAPDANGWRPVMPNVVAAVPQPQMVQPYMAQPNIAQQWRPDMPVVPVAPTHAYAQPQPVAPAWPQHNNVYVVPAPMPVAPVQAPVPVQPWWWQGQQWQTYPYAKPWPGYTSNIIADFPANMCAGCKT